MIYFHSFMEREFVRVTEKKTTKKRSELQRATGVVAGGWRCLACTWAPASFFILGAETHKVHNLVTPFKIYIYRV